MAADGGVPRVELVIAATSARFDENDARWVDQVADLHQTLRAQGVDVRREIFPVPGRKGGIEQVVLALGSAGVFTNLVTAFKSWIKRDRGRALRISVKVDGKVREYEVSGTDADDATLKELMKVAVGGLPA